MTAITRSIRNLFLPEGFPETVADGYWEYQVYDSLQGLCSYLRGVVSSAHILQAAGVGNATATAWSAALTWAIRDGLGLFGGLCFSAFAAPLFDAYVKEFRFFADLINNVGLLLDMVSPLVVLRSSSTTASLQENSGGGGSSNSRFLLLAAASSLCKTMCGMSAGATKGSITQHFAITGNLADLHAKEGTQETLVNIIGMVLGIGLAQYFHQIEQEQQEQQQQLAATGADYTVMFVSDAAATAWKIQWSIFMGLTALHVWSNYRAVQILRLRTLNRQRTVHVLRPMWKGLANKLNKESGTTKFEQSLLSSLLEEIQGPSNVQESLAESTYHMLLPVRWSPIALGARLVDLVKSCCHDENEVNQCLEEFANERYVLAVNEKSLQIYVSLLTGANTGTELRAFFHALLVQECLRQRNNKITTIHVKEDHHHRLVQITHCVTRQLFDDTAFIWPRLQDVGWETKHLHLGFARRRSRWFTSKKE